MSIELTTLENGLRVVSDRSTHVESVAVGLWLATGARYESPADNGAAHLIEHMVFKGTARRSALDIAAEIEAVGGHLNAYTTREHTSFHAKVLKEDVGLAVDIIADMVLRPAFDADELRREQAVVLQEIGQAEDTPDDIVFDHLQAVAFPDQPLGKPVLGTPGSVSAMTREGLFAFLRRHYGPGTAVLSAAGNVDHARLVDLAHEQFDTMTGAGAPEPSASYYRGGEMRSSRDLEQVHFLLGFPGFHIRHDDLPAEAVFSMVLGGGMSSRLFQEVREKRGLVYSIYSSLSAYADSGMFRIYAGTGAEELAELVPIVCAETARIAEDAGEDEIERGKAQLRAQYLMGLESMDGRCEQNALQWLRLGRIIPHDEMIARIEAVDRAALRRVSAQLLAGPLSLAVLGPIDGLETYDMISKRLAAA